MEIQYNKSKYFWARIYWKDKAKYQRIKVRKELLWYIYKNTGDVQNGDSGLNYSILINDYKMDSDEPNLIYSGFRRLKNQVIYNPNEEIEI